MSYVTNFQLTLVHCVIVLYYCCLRAEVSNKIHELRHRMEEQMNSRRLLETQLHNKETQKMEEFRSKVTPATLCCWLPIDANFYVVNKLTRLNYWREINVWLRYAGHIFSVSCRDLCGFILITNRICTWN